jgi:acetyl esterase
VLAVGGAPVLTSAVLVLGTFLPSLPYVGLAGSVVLPPNAASITVIALVGAGLAVLAAALGARRAGTVLGIVGMATAVGAGTVAGSHVVTGNRNGAHVNILATLLPRGAASRAEPDATVPYTRDHGRDLSLDVYRRTSGGSLPAPVLVYTHGGGWIGNDRTSQAASLRWFADQGYLVVSPDYTLASDQHATWDTAAAQVACALTWVAGHAARYGGDPARMFAYGDSAGGALALSTAYAAASGRATSSCGGTVPTLRAVAAEYPAVDPVSFYDNDDPVMGDKARTMVRRYLGGSPSDHPDRVRYVSSKTYITPQAPPTIVFLVSSDHLVPGIGTREFVDRARQAGVDVSAVTFRWADHGVNLRYHSAVNQAMLQIMLRHFGRYGG